MTNATVGTVTKAPEGMVLHVIFKGCSAAIWIGSQRQIGWESGIAATG